MDPNESTTRARRRRVAIVAGGRTPFVKAGKDFKHLSALELACHSVKGLIERHQIDASTVQSLAYGVVIPEPGKPNLARELVLEGGLPKTVEAQTLSSYCITSLRAVTAIADAIGGGRIDVGIAGGVDSFSHADPSVFQEPSTGLTMGQHTEITRDRDWTPLVGDRYTHRDDAGQ